MSAMGRTIRLLASAAVLILLASTVSAQTRTFTLDADFDEGYLFNVNHDSPNNDQLQLNTVTTPFPFINVACSGRGTVVRIDVETGSILGEYLSAPAGRGRNPSRTTVDLFGNVWVANRDESEGGRGSVTRIGLIIGGTRCDAAGNPDPAGQYLKPPFMYSTVADRDGDGLIKTSYGLGNVLAWTNLGGVDSNGGVSTADDECIINYTRVAGTGTRTIAVTSANDIWVGGYGDLDHERVSGATGLPVPGTLFNLGCGGYGGVVDGNGILWSADINRLRLLRYDTSAATGTCINLGRYSYGLGIDNDGNIWNSNWSHNSIMKLSPAGAILGTYPLPGGCHRGVAITPVDNNVWVANSCANAVHRLSNAGAVLATISVGATPTGVAVDANGKVWVTNYDSNSAMRIDPATNTVDLTVALGSGAHPYNYSDMTGIVVAGYTAPSGIWAVVHDGGEAGMLWGNVAWNQEPQGAVPAGCYITVEVRAADDLADLAAAVFVPVDNGVDFDGVEGRYIEIRATLARDAGVQVTPVLSDLTVSPLIEDIFVDIKPTSCPNPVNVKSKGVLPVAILGTDQVDVTEIDPATIRLAGVEPLRTDVLPVDGEPTFALPPVRWAYEDVAAPYEGELEGCESCTTAGPDGYMDMTVKFDTEAVIAAVMADLPADLPISRKMCLILTLTFQMNGRTYEASDVIRLQNADSWDPELPATGAGFQAVSPNPFNPTTKIEYALARDGAVDLSVYDLAGRKVETLVDETQAAGQHATIWDASGKPSGLYFLRLRTDDGLYLQRITLLK